MNSGLYSALSGNLAAMRRLEVISNNLANANTPGFKKDRLSFESVLGTVNNPTQGGGGLTDAPVLDGDRFYTDYSAGQIRQSGNTLDVALSGDGFFVVNTPQGRAYTRQGNFQRDATGKLVTNEGYEVQGNGPITISGGKVDIDERGRVFIDGVQTAALEIVDFPKPYALQKTGSALFVPANPQVTPQPATNATVMQGALEESNVLTIQEMAQMLEASRYFEMCQKVVRSYDDLAAKAANDLGKV